MLIASGTYFLTIGMYCFTNVVLEMITNALLRMRLYSLMVFFTATTEKFLALFKVSRYKARVLFKATVE